MSIAEWINFYFQYKILLFFTLRIFLILGFNHCYASIVTQ